MGCIGGLAVAIIAAIEALAEAVTEDLTALGARKPGLVALATLPRADFDAFFAVSRVLFAPFFTVRRAGLVAREADFAECVLMKAI